MHWDLLEVVGMEQDGPSEVRHCCSEARSNVSDPYRLTNSCVLSQRLLMVAPSRVVFVLSAPNTNEVYDSSDGSEAS